MALLDVTDVLEDPDFSDNTLVRERNSETIDEHGRAQRVPVQDDFSGVVLSDAGDLLNLVADAAYVSGSINIYTPFALSEGSEETSADVVIWKSRRFTVMDVQDYSHFASGFVCAKCEPQKPAGA